MSQSRYVFKGYDYLGVALGCQGETHVEIQTQETASQGGVRPGDLHVALVQSSAFDEGTAEDVGGCFKLGQRCVELIEDALE